MRTNTQVGGRAAWSPILVGHLLRSGRPNRVSALTRLAVTVLVLASVSIALAIVTEIVGGYGHAIAIGSFSFAWLPCPPLVIGTLTLFWVGPAGAMTVLVASNLVVGWWIGLGMPWLAMYAGADVLLVLLFACSFSLSGARVDLRNNDSLVTFLFTSLAAAISVLPAAVVWSLALPARQPGINQALEEWFSGCLVALLLIVGPLLRHATGPVLRARSRLLGGSGVHGAELRLYGERVLWVALVVLVVFVVGGDLLLRQELASVTGTTAAPGIRQTVREATGVVGRFAYSLLGLSLALIIGLVYVRRRLTRRLEAVLDRRTATLRRTVAELEHAQLLARTGAWQLDAERSRLTFSNGMYDLIGVPRDDPSGRLSTLEEFIVPADRPRWKRALARALDEGQPLDAQFRLETVNGAVRWVHARGSRVEGDGEPRFTGTFIDVTEWRRRERELQRLTEHVDRIVQHSPAAIVTLDTEGRVVLFSPAAERIFGYPAAAVVGGPPPFVGESQREQYDAIVRRVLSGDAVHNVETVRTRADGQPAHVSLSAAPIKDDDGRVIGVLGILVDISETVAGRERLRELSEHLEEQVLQRTAQLKAANENLEAFAQTASHDLQAPLRAIGSFAELLRDRHADRLDQRGRDYLDRIIVSQERMHRLIRDVLAYSRVGGDARALRRVDLAAILRATAAELTARHPEAILVLPEGAAEVVADETLVRQVFANLLENALVYTLPGATPDVAVRIDRRPDGLTVSIRDRGVGIAARHQERIFRPFERLHTEEEYRGTGLGLTIVRRCTDLLGWEISVAAEEGRGSTFTVRVPDTGTERD